MVLSLKDRIDENIDKFRIADSLENIFDIYRRCNKYIDETTPWVLAKDDSMYPRLSTVLYNLIEAIRIATVFLQAYLPDTAKSIFEQINTDITGIDSVYEFGKYVSGTKVTDAKALFMRIDKDK